MRFAVLVQVRPLAKGAVAVGDGAHKRALVRMHEQVRLQVGLVRVREHIERGHRARASIGARVGRASAGRTEEARRCQKGPALHALAAKSLAHRSHRNCLAPSCTVRS